MQAVWERSSQRGTALLLLLAIADNANDEGEAWPSVPTMAKKIRMSERYTRIVLRELEASGELVIKPARRYGIDSNTLIIKIPLNQTTPLNPSSPLPLNQGSSTPEPQFPTPLNPSSAKPSVKPSLVNHQKENRHLPAKAGAPKADPAILFQIASALASVTGMDLEKNKGHIFKEAKTYKLEDIPKIAGDYSQGGLWYSCDWRGQKGQPPSLAQIRETWGNLKFPNGNGHNNGAHPGESMKERLDRLIPTGGTHGNT